MKYDFIYETAGSIIIPKMEHYGTISTTQKDIEEVKMEILSNKKLLLSEVFNFTVELSKGEK